MSEDFVFDLNNTEEYRETLFEITGEPPKYAVCRKENEISFKGKYHSYLEKGDGGTRNATFHYINTVTVFFTKSGNILIYICKRDTHIQEGNSVFPLEKKETYSLLVFENVKDIKLHFDRLGEKGKFKDFERKLYDFLQEQLNVKLYDVIE